MLFCNSIFGLSQSCKKYYLHLSTRRDMVKAVQLKRDNEAKLPASPRYLYKHLAGHTRAQHDRLLPALDLNSQVVVER